MPAELIYVKTVPWRCTRCGASGHVEYSDYRHEVFERAWAAHELADPLCCLVHASTFVFLEESPE